ncbi:expressed unknown protein [Seminavis robusta]|uniref:DUF6824 domain-containing protein n=1 Tax=Seminavis robusta TaxID=568900 RepID=A0A9N8HLC0_9STRA|nr:expressed unknown protein [Seminavis robusta]|eukprot:Sro903_g218300.1 n/a (321) ;mRNA; f:28363-29451
MNINDWNDDFNTLSTSGVTMNFDDGNEEPRLAINLEAGSGKLAARDDLGINANDVLCGRGKTSFNHVGNRRFRHIISESIDDYNNAGSRKAKSAVVKKVHDHIRATGGRFLKMDSSEREWVELSQQRSLEKVSHAIRDATTTNENMKKKKQKVHSTIAQVAAHVSSRFPGVQLEGNFLDDSGDDATQGDRLAFTSIDDTTTLPMPPLPGQVTSAAASAPEASSIASSIVPPAAAPAAPAAAKFPSQSATPEPETSSIQPLFPEHPPLSPHHHHHHHQGHQSPDHVHHEDDFLSYINEVLGPVSPQDMDSDPLKRLARRKR